MSAPYSSADALWDATELGRIPGSESTVACAGCGERIAEDEVCGDDLDGRPLCWGCNRDHLDALEIAGLEDAADLRAGYPEDR